MIKVKIYKVEQEPYEDEMSTLKANLSFNSEKEARDYLVSKGFTLRINTYGGAYADAYKIISEEVCLEAFISEA